MSMQKDPQNRSPLSHEKAKQNRLLLVAMLIAVGLLYYIAMLRFAG